MNVRACNAKTPSSAPARQAGGLHINSTHLVRGGRTELLPKRGIWEAEMAEPATQAAVRTWRSTRSSALRLAGKPSLHEAPSPNPRVTSLNDLYSASMLALPSS